MRLIPLLAKGAFVKVETTTGEQERIIQTFSRFSDFVKIETKEVAGNPYRLDPSFPNNIDSCGLPWSLEERRRIVYQWRGGEEEPSSAPFACLALFLGLSGLLNQLSWSSFLSLAPPDVLNIFSFLLIPSCWLAAITPSFAPPKFGDRDFWPGPMPLEKQTLKDLEVLSQSFFESGWLLENVMASFNVASKEVKKKLQEKLAHPARTHKEILQQRIALKALLEVPDENWPETLDKLVGLVRRYSELKKRFLLDLVDLRTYHYPYFCFWMHRVKFPIHKPDEYREPYPDVTPALITLGRIIILLRKVYKTLPDKAALATMPENSAKVISQWKRKIRKTLKRKELEPFIRRKALLKVFADIRTSPYVFLAPDELERFIRSEKGMYGHKKEKDEQGRAKIIHNQLRAKGLLETVLKEFSELAENLKDLWVINADSHAEGSLTPRNERSSPSRKEALPPLAGSASEILSWMDELGVNLRLERQELRASRRHAKHSGDKHPFIRQFPDGMMQSPLSEIEYYSTIALFAIKYGYKFADINQPTGTIRLSSYRNSVLITRILKEKKKPTRRRSLFDELTEMSENTPKKIAERERK
jgi:hypothetical protein